MPQIITRTKEGKYISNMIHETITFIIKPIVIQVNKAKYLASTIFIGSETVSKSSSDPSSISCRRKLEVMPIKASGKEITVKIIPKLLIFSCELIRAMLIEEKRKKIRKLLNWKR